MKFLQTIFIAIVLIFFSFGCGTTNPSVKAEEEISSYDGVQDPDPTISLSEHLKRVPGVMVRGSGPTATITVRGINSINSSNEPLFVVNGQVIEGGYRTVSSVVTVHDIKSIKVLKNATDTTFYGFRGANGVIEIKLKK